MINDNTGVTVGFNNLLIDKAYRYYLKGLNAGEIGKLLDISPRTVQRYVRDHKFKEVATPKTLQKRVGELHQQGHSYREIARIVRKSRTTVYYYLKKIRNS